MRNLIKSFNLLIFVLLMVIVPVKVNATSITLNKSEMMLGVGVSEKLQYTLSDGLNSSNIVWTSSNQKVATVSGGKVTGITYGKTVITASINGTSASCIVTVSADYVSLNSISLNTSTMNVLVGDTETLNVSFNPSNASNKSVVWTSSNNSIASVSGGKVIGKKVGVAIVTASVSDKSVTCVINVVDKISLNNISISKSSLSMKEGESQKLSVNYYPSNATNKKVSFSSSNTKVVVVDNNGNVTAKGVGSAMITVVSNDGGHVDQCSVVVEAISKNVVSISLDKNELELKVGEEGTVKYVINPSYAENKNVTWESSNKKIATVKDGVITAVSPGEAEIKVITEDGNKEAICKVNVVALPIESISFKNEELTVFIGSETELEIISIPDGSVLENPIWTSSDEKVATVSDGVVLAKSFGSTSVSVSNEDGSISAEIVINVIEKPLDDLNIEVKNYKLDFSPDKKDYTLTIGNEDVLNIIVNRSDSKVSIKGNNNLKNGSIITVTIDDGEKTTYIINIKKKGNYTIIFIAIISGLLLLNLIRMLVKSKKKS